MGTIEWKRGSPLRYLSTSKPSILGRSMPRKRRSAGPCRERKRSASTGSSKQTTRWPSRRRMTSRILRVVGEVSSTMTLNCRVTLVPPSCLLSAVVCSLHSHDSMPPSCAPHVRSPGQSAHSRCTHDVRWIQEWPRAPPMTVPRGAGEVAPFRSLEVQEEKASDRKKLHTREGRKQEIRFTNSSRRITTSSFRRQTVLL